MSESPKAGAGAPERRKRITLERVYHTDVQHVWDLWTTKDSIESWWGPGGFAVTVHKLDLRPGGELLYAMTAVDPPQVEFIKKAGMPLTQELRITYTEIVPLRRLAYVHLTDFIPGVEPYDVATVVELQPTADGVSMTLTFDAMHNDEWTERAVMGWKIELGKADALMAARTVGGSRERTASTTRARAKRRRRSGWIRGDALLSLGTDVVMHATGVFPPWEQPKASRRRGNSCVPRDPRAWLLDGEGRRGLDPVETRPAGSYTTSMSSPSNRQLAVEEFVSRLRQALSSNILDVRLFGSEARGEATSESDIDVLVVVQPDMDRVQFEDRIIDIAFDVNLDFGVYISPRVVTPGILNDPVWRETPFIKNVARESIPL